jgi:hypothetical protein
MGFRKVVAIVILLIVLVALARQAGRVLIVDEPVSADAIVVLAGESNSRPELALDLLHKGLVPHVFFDAEERSLIYDELLVDIAQRYINARGEQSRVSVCPVRGSSTSAEVRDVNRCLQTIGAHSVLIVTSEFHTRRALMILKHSLPQYQFHVAAAYNSWQFGEKWWTNREWAKTVFDEWLKTAWWVAVDRWRM